MFPELREIKKRRRRLGWSQLRLARAVGCSQSMIAKIEAVRCAPSYGLVKRIFEAFDIEERSKGRGKRAKDVMSKRVLFVSKKDKIKKAIELMRENDFSQLPVMENGMCVGGVTEGSILYGKKGAKRVEEAMTEQFPIVGPESPVEMVSALLRHAPAVLVAEKGEIKGIITKTDLLSA